MMFFGSTAPSCDDSTAITFANVLISTINDSKIEIKVKDQTGFEYYSIMILQLLPYNPLSCNAIQDRTKSLI
jgi:hypothetical protein